MPMARALYEKASSHDGVWSIWGPAYFRLSSACFQSTSSCSRYWLSKQTLRRYCLARELCGCLRQQNTYVNCVKDLLPYPDFRQGPSAFPIVFAAIVGQLMSALGAWKLERQVAIGLLESLLASRSLASVVVSLFKLRIFTVWTPLILLVWCLSPLGGQASLRIVGQTNSETRSFHDVYFLDTNSGYPIGFGNPNDETGDYSMNWPVRSAFVAALASPGSSKNGSQDMFRNLQIPMLETLNATTTLDGWHNITDQSYLNYGLVGVPLAQVPARMNSTFNISSSYVSLDCSVDKQTLDYAAIQSTPEGMYTMWNITGTAASASNTSIYHGVNLQGSDVSGVVYGYGTNRSYCQYLPGYRKIPAESTNWTCFDTRIMDASPTHLFNTSVPRRIGFQSFAANSTTPNQTIATEAWCDMTTTYVDVMAKCEGVLNCTAMAVRRSISPPWPSSATSLDGITFMNASAIAGNEQWTRFWGGPVPLAHTAASFFFSGFMSSAATFRNGYTAMEHFFLNPDAPFELDASDRQSGEHTVEVKPLADIGAVLFSRRFAQLLNTFWMASCAPIAIITGSTSSDDNVYNITQENHGALFASRNGSNITTAEIVTIETVLEVNKAWAAGLISISAMLIVAGIAGFLFDVWQKSPSVIDYFVSNLRHNPYAEIGEHTSTEDGADMARRLRHTTVQIGDVRSDEDVGMIAIVTPTESRPVQEIRRRRVYT